MNNIDPLPKHLAIIMDGNGRWAKSRGLARTAGHLRGRKVFENTVDYCEGIGIKHLSFYAFSTENWKRPKKEVDFIMKLLGDYLDDAERRLAGRNIRVTVLGETEKLGERAAGKIADLHRRSENRDGMRLNIAINYGGRSEILRAARELARYAAEGKLEPDSITEDVFANMLYTAGQPDPDLIIRPSGERRLSNFMLWQAAYSELWYSDVLWPDFTPAELEKALGDFAARERRYGDVQAAENA